MEIFALAPFGDWKYQDAIKELNALLPANYAIAYDYAVLKDQYRKGEEWVGPGKGDQEEIEKQFTPDDFITDGLNNIVNAFLEPQLGVVPLQEVQEGQKPSAEVSLRIAETKNLLTWWWDIRKLHETTQDRLRTSAWAGWAAVRIWIAHRFLRRREDGTIGVLATSDPRRALEYIFVSKPMPHECGIVTDEDTQDRCCIRLSTVKIDGREVKRAELSYLDPERTFDDEAKTIVRYVYENEQSPATQTTMALGGHLLATEMRTPQLLTNNTIRTQRQLNFLVTMITRLAESSGFRGRYIANAKPLGKKRPLIDGEMIPEGSFVETDAEMRMWLVVPEPRTLGASTTTELVGLPKKNQDGDDTGYESPSITLEEPVDPTPYILAAEAVRRRGLRGWSQGHLAQTSTAEASGFAYEQSRATFEKDLNGRRFSEEGMLRDEFLQVLALVEFIINKPGYFTKMVRVTVDQRVDPGPRSADAMRLEMEAGEAGMMSQETVMSRLGIEDLEGEMARIRKSNAGLLKMLERASALVDKFGPDAIIRLLIKMDIPEDLADVLKSSPTDRPFGPKLVTGDE